MKTKRRQLIDQINEFDNRYFNQDQKIIIEKILEHAPNEEVQTWFDFLVKKKRLGFHFDYSPEVAKGRIILLNNNEKLNINCSKNEINSKNENKLIVGDNYNALKALNVTHKEKVDIIYIDPPYNTEAAANDGNNNASSKEGSASNFIYKDKFGPNGWLNMMQDRLKLAKDLLKDDGVIFVSIDDSEQAYLKVLMDDIFGENNFVGCWPRLKSTQGKNDSFLPVSKHDFLLIFCKQIKMVNWSKKQMDSKDFKYDDNDGRGSYHLKNYISATEGLGYVKSLDFEIEINGQVYEPISKGKRTRWLWNKERIEKAKELNILVPKGNLVYSKKYLNWDFNKNNELVMQKSQINFDSLDILENNFSNKQGTKDLEIILSGKKFDYPKPVNLIKYCINMINKKDALILDFFAGSGTTGQAVMELNREDGGNRKFIICTNNENNIAYDVTYERLFRVINGKGSKDEEIEWASKNEPYLGTKLRVIDIDDSRSIDFDQENIDDIQERAINGLKLLDDNYSKSMRQVQLYYDLAALNPLEKENDIDELDDEKDIKQ